MSERSGDFIKFDVSKLSGKADVLPKGVEDRAFLGSDNEGLYRRQITKIAGQLDDTRIMDDSTADRETKTATILHENFHVYSVGELRDRQQDPNLALYVRENLKKAEERLAKSVYVSLKKAGVSETVFASPGEIDDRLPDGLKGLGEKISSFIITEPVIKRALAAVDVWRNQVDLPDYDEKREFTLDQIESAEKEIKKVIVTSKPQAELALSYLSSLKDEIVRSHEKEGVTDEIVTFLNDHVLRSDVTVDEDLNLRNLHGGDDFEIELDPVSGREIILPNGEKKYVHDETVRWLREREAKASELIMICTGGEFSSIDEINEKINENGSLSSRYTRADGSVGDKEYLEGLKDTLGFCVYEAFQDARVDANLAILGTLNTIRLNKLLPMVMEGMSDDVVINAARDPFLREQLKTICLLDKKKEFSLLSIHGGFSGIETKEQLKRDINAIMNKIMGDKRMGVDREYTFEARRLQKWLFERNETYNQIIEAQTRIGRYGETIPSNPEAKNERLVMARKWLNYIEASGSPPGSLNIMDQVTKLFEMTQSDVVEPEIKSEINARLALSFMYYHMHAAGGLLNNRGQSIEDCHEQGFKEGLLIDINAMSFFLKDGANGLPVAECWDAIEDMNFGDSYLKLLKKIMGIRDDGSLETLTESSPIGQFLLSIKETGMGYLGIKGDLSDAEYLSKWTDDVRKKFLHGPDKLQNEESIFWGSQAENPMYNNQFTDTNGERKKIVMEMVLRDIKQRRKAFNVGKTEDEKLPVDEETLKKGYELASKLMEATAETSVFNPGLAGHNDFSELILTEANTKDRQKKMKPIGPRVAMSEIVSFYTTWPRYIAGPEPEQIKSVFGPLHAADIYPERMSHPKADSYFLMTAILPKKIEPVQAFFMKEDVGTKDVLTVEHWKKLFDPISKVVGYGQSVLCNPSDAMRTMEITPGNKKEMAYRLRLLAVKGVLQMATRPTTGWNWGDLYTLGKLVTTPYTVEDLADGGNKKMSFISLKDWEEIFKGAELAADMKQRLIQLNATEAYKESETIKINLKL